MKTTSEERLAVAKTIWAQIRATLTFSEIMSWGVMAKQALEYEGMPALAIRVSGLIHKGWVVVALDYSTDTYKIYLTQVNGKVKATYDDVYCDTLGEFIDRKVERGEYSAERYHELAMADSARKFNR